jgi:hypothetical protein
MSAPNIVNVSSIVAGYAGAAPSNIISNVLINNQPGTNAVIKVNSLVITNVTDNSVPTTVSINNSATGTGPSTYRLAYNIYVPSGASLQLVDKGNFLYLTEDTSIIVTSGTASALEYIAVYETIS